MPDFFSEQELRDLQVALQATQAKGDLPSAYRLKSWLVDNCDWFAQSTMEIYYQLQEWGIAQVKIAYPPKERNTR